MPEDSQASAEPLVSPWIFLFPATFLVHIAEEYWGDLPGRATELTGRTIPEAAFLAANAFIWVLMAAAVVFALRRPSRAPLVIALATAVTINATLHLGGTLLTARYSPGLFSGVLFWLPLGATVLARGRRALPERSFRFGVLIGVVMHLLVPLVGASFVLALGGGRAA